MFEIKKKLKKISYTRDINCKIVDSEARLLGFKSSLCQLLAL